jgi:hypothetical protein
MGDDMDHSAETADFEESDARDTALPMELEYRAPDENPPPDEIDLPDPGLKVR